VPVDRYLNALHTMVDEVVRLDQLVAEATVEAKRLGDTEEGRQAKLRARQVGFEARVVVRMIKQVMMAELADREPSMVTKAAKMVVDHHFGTMFAAAQRRAVKEVSQAS
jgi:hypothetical protein